MVHRQREIVRWGYPMDSVQESYRRYVIGQLQLWEGKIAHLKSTVQRLEDPSRRQYEERLQELERVNRTVFHRYGDLLLAGNGRWVDKQAALDDAVRCMQTKLDEFGRQTA